jgi:hypothetical protein
VTGPEHYREAEAVLAQVKDRNVPAEVAKTYAAVAQVHADLAIAAAIALQTAFSAGQLGPGSVQQWADLLFAATTKEGR